MTLGLKAQKYEVRAVWLTTIGGIDWPTTFSPQDQKREMTRLLDKLKQAGINTVLIQTRIRATTIYPSTMEPFDHCLTGTHGHHPGYDPLQFIIDESHRRGMECHAWMVTLPIGKTYEQRFKEFRRRHPQMVKVIGQEGYMNPELPETRRYLADICGEVTRRYDIDGIHLDYLRYPEAWPKAKRRDERNERREHITNIVRHISNTVKQLKPWVKMSCSPIGKYSDLSRYRSGGWNAYNAVYQDAQGWLRQGLMDQLYPMLYFRDNNFYPFALDWQEQACGRTIVGGLGIYFLSPREGNWTLDDVSREMHFLRQNGMGHCYFRAQFLTENHKGIYSFARSFDQKPALIPPMTWASNLTPEAPTLLNVTRTTTADCLKWEGAADHSGSPYLLYNVYASTTPNIDTNETGNLIATRLRAETITVPHTRGQQLYYAVTAIDRYGNESSAKTNYTPILQQAKQVVPLTPCDTHIIPFYYLMTKKERKKLGY